MYSVFLVCHALCWALQTAQWQAPKGPVLLVCRPEGGAGALPSPSWKLLNISSACVPSPCTLVSWIDSFFYFLEGRGLELHFEFITQNLDADLLEKLTCVNTQEWLDA